MPVNKRLQKSFRKFSNTKEEKVITITGELGLPLGGQKLVEVPNRNGFVYVRLRNNTSEVIQAYNSEVSTIYGLPVLVARQNNIYKVIGRDQDRYRDWSNIPYLPKHGGQHSFEPSIGMGADITWIYSPQFMPLLAYPSGSSGSPRLSVAPFTVRDLDGNFKYVGNTGTPSTQFYNPNTGSRAIMALVYLDTVSGNPYLLVNSGSYFADSLTGTNQVMPYVPKLHDPNGIPLAAVRLLSGTTSLTWNNIYDVRPFLRVVPTATGTASTFNVWDEGILQGVANTLNVVGVNADISVSGTVARLFVTGTPGAVSPPITGSIVFQTEGNTLGSATILNVFDGINASISGSTALLYPNNDGWIQSRFTWSYLSADSPSFVATIGSNVTGTIGVGDKIKLTQTSEKFFFVTAIGVTGSTSYINLYGGTDYTLANAVISSLFYSRVKAPFGFPLNPDKWTVSLNDTTNAAQASPVNTTSYNLGSLSLDIPIGAWEVTARAFLEVTATLTATRLVGMQFGFSSLSNGLSDTEMIWQTSTTFPNIAITYRFMGITMKKLLTVTSKTPYYMIGWVNVPTDNATNLAFRGDFHKTMIRAVCAYL